jgi:TldD protein
MDRRNFLKTGGMVVLGSMAASSVLRAESLKGAHDASGISSALNHFGVSQEDMKKVLAAALEKGGDMPTFSLNNTFNNYVGLQDGAVNRCNLNIDFGVGIRVLAATKPVMLMWRM